MVNAVFFALLLLVSVAPVHAASSQDLLLEAELIPAQVYVQAQGVYRLRFYQGVDVRDIRFAAPSARLVEIRPIGTGRVFESQRAGRRYRVHERSYAVIPFASGPLQLAGAQVSGSLPGQRAMRMQAPAQTLSVLPAPVAAGDTPWLPARVLTLSEQWSAPADAMRQGVTVRRSVRVEAVGVDAAQLPELPLAVSGMMVHAEPAHLENRYAGNFNVGIREQAFSLVPLVAGSIAVPELRLVWWNVETGAPDAAVLPARALHVATAPHALQSAAGWTILAAMQKSSASWRPYGVAILIALLMLLLLQGRLRSWWRLLQVSRAGDVGATRDALLAWASCYWPETPPMTLAALAVRLQDQEARRALADMERALYGRDPGQGCAAWLPAAVHRVRRSIRAAGKRARWHNGRVCKQSSRA